MRRNHPAQNYAMLLASLPHLGDMFSASQPPVSRTRLEKRLAMMEPEARAELEEITSLLCWHRADESMTTEAIFARAEAYVIRHHGTFLAWLIQERMEMRSVIAALRLRGRGAGNAAIYRAIGFGEMGAVLARHYQEEDFGLSFRYPWLRQGTALLASGDVLGFERLILGTVWQQLERLHYDHHFTLEAVVLYVLRWDILERWTQYNAAQAVQRFEHLKEAALS